MSPSTERRAGPGPKPTGPDSALTARQARRSRGVRRVGVALMVVLVALGLTGVLGQRTSTVAVDGAGYRMWVTYPSVVRPGLDVRFNVALTNPAGFGRSLNLAFDRHYFDLFDLNGVRPDPD